MTYDYNRNVFIQYNLLNLPKKVLSELDTTKYMTYAYDSDGKKLSQFSRTSITDSLREDYIDNKIYENGVLTKVLIPGGYLQISSDSTALPTYYYFAKDHLGNVRQIQSNSGETLEKNDYYSFGLRQNRADYCILGSNKYKYNGKEQNEFGTFITLDYGARMYDPALGRWNVVDPLAEKYYSISPYVYCSDKPIIMIDTDGRDFKRIYDDKNKTVTIRANYYYAISSTTSARKAISFWNNQKKLSYKAENGETYKIVFKLTGKRSNHPKAEAEQDKIGNSITSKIISDEQNKIVTGQTENNKDITLNSKYSYEDTAIHEIGHTLGMPDAAQGLMTSNRESRNGSAEVTQEDVNKMMDSPKGQSEKKNDVWTFVKLVIKLL